MITTVLGILIILAPLQLVFCFKNRMHGFINVLVLSGVFHLALAVTTQIFHVFTYPVLMSVHAAAAAASLVLFVTKANRPRRVTLNWFVISAFCITTFQFWSVHNNYTGTVSTIGNSHAKVEHSSYPYPYFSDEWICASLAKYSIQANALPLANPLHDNEAFDNILLATHPVAAEAFLLLNLDAVSHFWILPFTSGLIVCILLYVLMRALSLSSVSAALATLLATYVTNGANLPGIWYLLPFIPGFAWLVAACVARRIGEERLSFLCLTCSLIFYPPMIVFVGAYLVGARMLDDGRSWRRKAADLAGGLMILAAAVLGVILALCARHGLSFLYSSPSFVVSYLIRKNLDGGIASFPIWQVMPKVAVAAAAVGLWRTFKEQRKIFFLILPLAVGLIFWCVYAFVAPVFLIEYPRVVVISSLLLIIFAGWGFEWIRELARQNVQIFSNRKLSAAVEILVILPFVLWAPYYTRRETWSKFEMVVETAGGLRRFSPAAPANHYLIEADLEAFNAVKGKRFIAPPWKGLVIGVATGNYPLESKDSSIINRYLTFADFVAADCGSKTDMALKFGLNYAYAPTFQCANFKAHGSSPEGLILYQFVPPASRQPNESSWFRSPHRNSSAARRWAGAAPARSCPSPGVR